MVLLALPVSDDKSQMRLPSDCTDLTDMACSTARLSHA